MICSADKKQKIKQSIQQTKDKRKNQVCKVFSVKIDKSHLSKNSLEFLNKIFLEAKWLYNYCLNQDDIFAIDTKIKNVQVLNKDKILETRQLTFLSSQLKQAVIDRCKQNIINLSKAKKKGLNVGKLKYKKEINCIFLQQYGNTFNIKNNFIRIQGMKKYVRVNGLNQIKKDYDIACANLIKKNKDFYINITCFLNKTQKYIPDNEIGIDFGIKDDFVFSNGIKIKTDFDLSSIRKEQKKLSKKKKGSKNYLTQKLKLNKKYEKLNNQKEDTKNKIVSYLKYNFNHIAIQNENIKGWQKGLFGKKISKSILGATLSKLKKHDKTKIIDRLSPTTKICYICGQINKISLAERIYNCDCGLKEDRDIKSAKTILLFSKNEIPMVYREFKPVEKQTSANMLNYFNMFVSYIFVKQEAQCFNIG